MCVCIDESVDVWSESTRRARKPHTCEECHETIAPGDTYVRVATLYDGSWSDHALCSGCRAWASAYNATIREVCGCSGYWIGQLWPSIVEFAREHLGYDPNPCMEVSW
jgi:hypothetical protein